MGRGGEDSYSEKPGHLWKDIDISRPTPMHYLKQPREHGYIQGDDPKIVGRFETRGSLSSFVFLCVFEHVAAL